MKFKPSFLLVVPLLFATGCGHQLYADKLKLPALSAPAALAPVGPMDEPTKNAIATLENASSPSQADGVVTQVRQGNAVLSLLGGLGAKNPEFAKEFSQFSSFLEQAAQIKRAQLEDGDAKDSTGEVGQRLEYVRQSAANLDFLAKQSKGNAIPVSPSGAGSPPGGVAPASAPVPPEEQAWINGVNAANQQIVESDFHQLLDVRARTLMPAFRQASAQHSRLIAPPRMARADQLYKQAYQVGLGGCDLLQQGASRADLGLIGQSRQKFDEYHDLLAKARAEVDAVTKGTAHPS